MLRDGDINLMVVTSSGDELDMRDGREIRRTAVGLKVPMVTTIAGAKATCAAIGVMQEGKLEMEALQDFF
jgi:carbamoyl-phosphate synthase large subunit